MINYGIVGSGWRAEFYARIARLVPDTFKAVGICVRNDEKAKYFSEKYGVKVFRNVDEMLAEKCDFVVNCINKPDIFDMSVTLSNKGVYVLAETPVMKPVKNDKVFERIQVAEQFHLKGTYQAIKSIIDSGVIGKVCHINISCCHDYHAMSLVRFFLDDYEKPILLNEYIFDDTVLKTNGRQGEIPDKSVTTAQQTFRMFKFKNASVVYDHSKEQYFSPIRKNRLLIRGSRGEIDNNTVRYFNKENKYVESEIKHISSGHLDGFFNDRITFEDKVLYEYPFREARLSEEETAIAMCLVKMKDYTCGGKELYGCKKAFEDYSFCY